MIPHATVAPAWGHHCRRTIVCPVSGSTTSVESTQPVHCPIAFGLAYTGTFYDGKRALATFTYGASGCQNVRVNAAGQSKYSLVMGPAASAAPDLQTDMAAALGLPKSAVYGPTQQINPGGPNKPVPTKKLR